MALPAKTSIRVDAIIDSAQRNLDAAKKNTYPADVAHSVLACLVEGLAHTLLSSKQQGQIEAVLALWKECSSSTAPVESERPSVSSPRQAS